METKMEEPAGRCYRWRQDTVDDVDGSEERVQWDGGYLMNIHEGFFVDIQQGSFSGTHFEGLKLDANLW